MAQAHEQTAVKDLLYRLADDELFMGHRNSEWTGIAPILEEDIAFSSMAQDEIGHAMAYYTLLHDPLKEPDPDTLAFRRGAQDFRNAPLTALPRGDWGHAIMRQFLYDAAEQIRLERYTGHPFEALAQLARKLRGEEKYHFLHAQMWVVKLGKGTDESRTRIQDALNQLWPYALGLFEPGNPNFEEDLAEASIQDGWLQLVCPVLVEARLQVAATLQDGRWVTDNTPIYGRYDEPTAERIDLLAAMQKVHRLDPNAEW